jgi:hypothetical protein
MLIALLLAIPAIVGNIYYLFLQNYVIAYDIVLNVIHVVFILIEFILTLVSIFNIKANEKSF